MVLQSAVYRGLGLRVRGLGVWGLGAKGFRDEGLLFTAILLEGRRIVRFSVRAAMCNIDSGARLFICRTPQHILS